MNYTLFLRGINVGGIKVPMVDLRELLAGLPATNVKTYLQTGNVTLTSDLPAGELKAVVEAALSERFGYQAFVQVLALDKLRAIVSGYPFPAEVDYHRYAILCDSQATADELAASHSELDPAVEAIVPGPAVVYWRVPIGRTLDTPFAKLIARPKYKSSTTNRNLNTLEKMLG